MPQVWSSTDSYTVYVYFVVSFQVSVSLVSWMTRLLIRLSLVLIFYDSTANWSLGITFLALSIFIFLTRSSVFYVLLPWIFKECNSVQGNFAEVTFIATLHN